MTTEYYNRRNIGSQLQGYNAQSKRTNQSLSLN